ncbi:hypothetical protein [Sandaracinus amylolyticus]|uniref:Uncharacterized protein n=1 Tax=Sandaracinus amylolyticus TaxID=927083 RepID=A0A0F6W7F6_9BACT|nr:hypothetical protein [Sandaracinus amylolyticus]AKF09355.1 hypothetical protein DB32_006504 [Sandaracinus amylolyticus]
MSWAARTVALLFPLLVASHASAQAPPDAALDRAVDHARAALDACAIASRASLAELRTTVVRVELARPRRVDVTVTEGPTGTARGGLQRCIARELGDVLRADRSVVAPLVRELRPYVDLALPMDPPPTTPRTIARPVDLVTLRAQLARLPDDRARLEQLATLERDARGVTELDAATLLDLFSTERRAAAGRLCRVAVGRHALERLMAPLAGPDRRWLRAATRGRCGVDPRAEHD